MDRVTTRAVRALAFFLLLPALSAAANPGFQRALASVKAAAAAINLDSLAPEAARKLDDSLAFLDSAGSPDRWTLALHEVQPAGAEEKAHREQRLKGAFLFVKNVANGFIRAHLDSARQDSLLRPLDAFQAGEIEQALAARMRNLEMLEIKYGPNSAKLNLAEIAVNHFLLRGLDAFGVDEQGRPGPLEIALAYSISYVTPSWADKGGTGIIVLSAFEAGLRIYFLRHGWGRGPLLPAYMAIGGLAAAKEQGLLRNPLETAPDYGAFFSWGSVKAGVVFGDDTRILLNRQFQFIPFLF